MGDRDDELAAFLTDVRGVVEADSFSAHMLWWENRHRDKPRDWQENLSGHGRCIGELDGRPVFVSLFTAVIDGQKILFIDATSEVVDHKMVRAWLHEVLPQTAHDPQRGRLNITDAMNFHNVFR